MSYELRIGNNIVVTESKRKTTPANIKLWWEAIKALPNYDSFNWFLVGGILNNKPRTISLNVCVTPKNSNNFDITEYELLESLMTEAMRIGRDDYRMHVAISAGPLIDLADTTTDWYRIHCWEQQTRIINGEPVVKTDINLWGGTVEQIVGRDLWRIKWLDENGLGRPPAALADKVANNSVVSMSVEDYVAQLDI